MIRTLVALVVTGVLAAGCDAHDRGQYEDPGEQSRQGRDGEHGQPRQGRQAR